MEKSNHSFKSLMSILIILITLFSIAFLQMEERRQNYLAIKMNKELKKIIEQRRSLEVRRLQALRPQKIEKEMERRTAFNRAESDQIIHLPNLSSELSQEFNIKGSESRL